MGLTMLAIPSTTSAPRTLPRAADQAWAVARPDFESVLAQVDRGTGNSGDNGGSQAPRAADRPSADSADATVNRRTDADTHPTQNQADDATDAADRRLADSAPAKAGHTTDGATNSDSGANASDESGDKTSAAAQDSTKDAKSQGKEEGDGVAADASLMQLALAGATAASATPVAAGAAGASDGAAAQPAGNGKPSSPTSGSTPGRIPGSTVTKLGDGTGDEEAASKLGAPVAAKARASGGPGEPMADGSGGNSSAEKTTDNAAATKTASALLTALSGPQSGRADTPALAPVGGPAHPSASVASPAAAAQSAPPAPDATDDQANLARIARGLQSAVNQRGGTVTIRLQPPELGALRVQMDLQNGQVRATFTTEHASVRDLLTHEMSQLRHALERQGLGVERLDVQTTPTSHGSGASSQQNGAGESGGDGRSRGEYAGGQSGSNQSGGSSDENSGRSFGGNSGGSSGSGGGTALELDVVDMVA